MAERTITILYFTTLAKWLGLESETITLPDEIRTVDDLIPWLMTRRGEWEKALAEKLKITMNGQSSGLPDNIHDSDEITLELVTEKIIN
jgi:molybdopterin converting factor small subunit